MAFYERLDVREQGIFCGGDVYVVNRMPEVEIEGVRQISVPAGHSSVSRRYRIVTKDMLPLPNIPIGAPRFDVAWEADGSINSRTTEVTDIRFSLAATEAGDVLVKQVSVTVRIATVSPSFRAPRSRYT